ncbi:MAG: hypothetical protein Q4C47_08840 [Planctomycetia bacterium]|nr:hypothetical protein [Planctomycetia bacterium]
MWTATADTVDGVSECVSVGGDGRGFIRFTRSLCGGGGWRERRFAPWRFGGSCPVPATGGRQVMGDGG